MGQPNRNVTGAFQATRSVEALGRLVLEPFLERSSDNGQYVLTDKGRLSTFLQETIGDALCNLRGDRHKLISVEFKTEQENKWGNFFLEAWSNRNLNLDDRESHALRGSNPGWFLKLSSDWLWYYFLDSDELFIMDLFDLKRWAFWHERGGAPKINEFEIKPQGKYVQLNDSWGWCVPIKTIQGILGKKMRLCYPHKIMAAVTGQEADEIPFDHGSGTR